jgi:hypothetical protein
MISIIICSKSPELLQKIRVNIEHTIGVPYEIIAIENSRGQIGICEAYNNGASKAKYDYLCFSHEDVIYHTQGWGKKLIAHLNNQAVGVIGVCGCTVKPKSPSGVWLNNSAVDRLSMMQTGEGGIPFKVYGNPENEVISEVITLDGVFLGCRKEVWEKNNFDQENLKDFHSYDVDFSLQVSRHFKNFVVYDIMLEHLSLGKNNKAWVDGVIAVEKKWQSYLPVYTSKFDTNFINEIEHYSLGYFLRAVIENKLLSKKYFHYYLNMFKKYPFKKENIRLIKYYIQKG